MKKITDCPTTNPCIAGEFDLPDDVIANLKKLAPKWQKLSTVAVAQHLSQISPELFMDEQTLLKLIEKSDPGFSDIIESYQLQ